MHSLSAISVAMGQDLAMQEVRLSVGVFKSRPRLRFQGVTGKIPGLTTKLERTIFWGSPGSPPHQNSKPCNRYFLMYFIS